MHKLENPYRPIETVVLEVTPETPTIKTIKLRPKEKISFTTGQFIELTIPGVGEAPFTPSSEPSVKDVIEVTVMKVGKVTEKIHQLKTGDIVGLRGPFGKGYPLNEFKGKEVLVVGGGCGFAPLRSLMYSLFEIRGELKKLLFRGGCKTPQELVYRSETEKWGQRKDLDLRLTVDEGDGEWAGHVGLVTTILDNLDMDCQKGIAVVCGPPIMMKFASQKLLNLGFQEENLFLSMEKNMSCGIGKCGHCRLGIYYACKDGPVFKYSQIKDSPEIWE
ncbi:MAG: FAD/NAD(P)-binding protein [Candidatus Omnitrophica bacterium]|nr:FAD/NAD(P)-binding protein [Candidatus Omnitrophota bacterium]